MPLYERVGNLHIHSIYSDGTGSHEELARFAAQAGLDFLIVTDHNLLARFVPPSRADNAPRPARDPQGPQGWYGRVLLLVGEEVHNPARSQVNHYLVLGVHEELAPYAADPQRLIQAVRERGGIGFIAHPYERASPFAGEPAINWLNWEVRGYDGLEIWNYMSEFKSYLVDLPRTLLYAFWPKLAIRGPFPETLAKWDELAYAGRVVAVGGSDAHANLYRLGPLARRVFSYVHLFRAVNTHVLLDEPWSGDAARDAQLIYAALARGRSFVAYDALAPARGFRFWAEQGETSYLMGDEIPAQGPVWFRAEAPAPAHLRLMLNGFCVAQARGREMRFQGRTPGVYRLEAYRPYALRPRGWIYSNPIWVRTQRHGLA